MAICFISQLIHVINAKIANKLIRALISAIYLTLISTPAPCGNSLIHIAVKEDDIAIRAAIAPKPGMAAGTVLRFGMQIWWLRMAIRSLRTYILRLRTEPVGAAERIGMMLATHAPTARYKQ